MYPLEMSFDDFRIGVIDINNKSLFLEEIKFMDLDHTRKRARELKNQFYSLSSTNDYILKLNKDRTVNDTRLRQMVEELCKRQYITNAVEFPIGYVKNQNNTIGQIVKHYPDVKSFKTVCLTESYEDLQKYIYLDDDSLHNLFLVYLNILEQIEQLFENGVSYLDVHSGNIVFFKDKIKLIDFEPDYITFSKIRYYQEQIIHNYTRLVNSVLNQFFLEGNLESEIGINTFSDIKKKVKKLENVVRRSI